MTPIFSDRLFSAQLPLTPEMMDTLLQTGVGTLALVVAILLLMVIAPVLWFSERRDQQRRKDNLAERQQEKELRQEELKNQRELIGTIAVNSNALVQQNEILQRHTGLLEEVVATNRQRITQSDDTATRIQSLPELIETNKNDAVDKVNKAMDKRLEEAQQATGLEFAEVKQELALLRRKMDEMLAILHQTQPPQEVHHTGNVTLSTDPPPPAPEPETPAEKDAAHDDPTSA